MPRKPLVLRDEGGVDQRVEVTNDGSVIVGDRRFPVRQTPAGEIRVGDRLVWAISDGDIRWVFVDGQTYTFAVQRPDRAVRRSAGAHGGLTSPMPATVIKVSRSPGDVVHAGETVLILEAMKMELPVRAAIDGVVVAVHCHEGDLVQPGQNLIEISESEPGQ